MRCGDERACSILRDALADFTYDAPAPLGFAIRSPAERNGLFVVVDRSGYVLARTRTPEESAEVVLAHLTAFLEPPEGTCSFRLRSVLGPEGMGAVALFPAFAVPPVIERELVRTGYHLVDSLAAHVSIDGTPALRFTAAPWSRSDTQPTANGHVGHIRADLALDFLVVPSTEADRISRAAIVAWLGAEAISNSDSSHVLDAAARLSLLEQVGYDPAAPRGVYAELARRRRT